MTTIAEDLIDTSDELAVAAENLRDLARTLEDTRQRLLAKAVELDTIRQKGTPGGTDQSSTS
jgi:hypothetical protein